MPQRLTAQFQTIGVVGLSDVDPDLDGANYEITLEVKADGAGAGGAAIAGQTYNKGNTSWQDQRKGTGHFWQDVTDLTDGTWYEAWWTWLKNGETLKGKRRVYYRDTTGGADNTPPDPPTVPGTYSATETTATIDYTEPADADFDHCDADYYQHGVWTRNNKDPFTGTLTGLTPGTSYYVVLHAFDTLGNRSAPSTCVPFTTTGAAGLAADAWVSEPLGDLQTLLANCAAFQTWVSAGDAEAAKASIGLVAATSTPPTCERYAVVMQGERFRIAAVAGGGPYTCLVSGELRLRFVGLVPEAYADDMEQAELWFTNSVGGILEDMMALAGSGSYLPVQSVEADEAPQRTSRDDNVEGVVYRWELRVSWGLGD